MEGIDSVSDDSFSVYAFAGDRWFLTSQTLKDWRNDSQNAQAVDFFQLSKEYHGEFVHYRKTFCEPQVSLTHFKHFGTLLHLDLSLFLSQTGLTSQRHVVLIFTILLTRVTNTSAPLDG